MLALAIETSCDETAAAILKQFKGEISVLSSVVSSQVKLHSQWGGVVPNLAAREHLKNIVPVLDKTFAESGITPDDLDIIGVTNGPGLIPALLIGTNAARSLAYFWNKPLLGIHHIEGHIYANLIGKIERKLTFPALILVVSGGHTQLILMKEHFNYRIVGQTLDDAVGEAFDKVARILGLGYPGGPLIAKEAENYLKQQKRYAIKFPRPMIGSKNLDFSFSGLKTAVMYLVKKSPTLIKDPVFLQAVCHEFQNAAVEVLIFKTLASISRFRPKTLMLAGGVSANKKLREDMEISLLAQYPKINYLIPRPDYSIDNAAMIGAAALTRWKKLGNKNIAKLNWRRLKTDANLKIHG